MKPVTPEDVARYLAGEIDDAAERQRIEQARQSDALVDAWFEDMQAELWQQLVPPGVAELVTAPVAKTIRSDDFVVFEFPQFALAAATGEVHTKMHGGPWDAELVESGRQIVLDLRAAAERAPFALARYTIFGPATQVPRPIVSEGWLTPELTESGQQRQGQLRLTDFVQRNEIGQCAYRLELITENNKYLIDPVTLQWLVKRTEDCEVRERLQELLP